MSTPIRYVFHEIEIRGRYHEEQVKNLIRVYRNIPTNSKYKDIKNLIPRLTYTVLIERHKTRSVRLYFNSDDIDDNPDYEKYAQERYYQNLTPQPSKKLKDGVYADTFDPANNSVSDLSVIDNFSDNVGGVGEQYKFLHCFYIPYITGYKVFFTLSNNFIGLQQRYLYQTDQNKFKVSHPSGIKFLLSAETPIFPEKKQQKENYLINAYRTYCQEGNITKNGDPLNQEQQIRINEVTSQVGKMKEICSQLQRSHRQSSLSSTTTTNQDALVDGQNPGPGPGPPQTPSQNLNDANANASSNTPTGIVTLPEPPTYLPTSNAKNSSQSTTTTVTPGGSQDLTLQELSKRLEDVIRAQNPNDDDGNANASSTTPTDAPNLNDGNANASSNTPGDGQDPTIQMLKKRLEDLKHPHNTNDGKTNASSNTATDAPNLNDGNANANASSTAPTPSNTPRGSFSQGSQGSLHNLAPGRSIASSISDSNSLDSTISLNPDDFQSDSQILGPFRDQPVASTSSSTLNKLEEQIQNLNSLQNKIQKSKNPSKKKVIKCIKTKKEDLTNRPPFKVHTGKYVGPNTNTKNTNTEGKER